MKLLVTGGCGFIGSNFIRLVLEERPEISITNVDCLTYAGNVANLLGVTQKYGPRYQFVWSDISNRAQMEALFAEHEFDAIVNFAAESHVDRSIQSSQGFVQSNIVGTATLLHLARKQGIRRFVQISTDEVYGSLGPEGRFTEDSPIQPSSPYSASKASADLLALAAHHTYGQEVLVTRCSNNYGLFQFPEKLIPLMIVNALSEKPLPVYGDGLNVRDWIHVEDHCRAVLCVLLDGRPGEVYNIGGDGEMRNIDVVKLILDHLGKSHDLITYIRDRPGHDRRYAIDSGKIHEELEWSPKHRPGPGLRETIDWYVSNRSWWEPLLVRK